MNKITQKLNSPARIAAFTVCAAFIIVLVIFATIKVGAGVNTNKSVGLDKGVNIALDDAGMSAEQVTNLSARYDTEDGISIYEVDFNANGCKYEYEIKASDGTILEAKRKSPSSQDSESEKSSDKDTNTPASSYIGVDKAKSIALQHAGLSASSVTFTKAKLDREDGIRVYEIEFYTKNWEYEYEIKASDGKIRDFDSEALDDDWDDDWEDD